MTRGVRLGEGYIWEIWGGGGVWVDDFWKVGQFCGGAGWVFG